MSDTVVLTTELINLRLFLKVIFCTYKYFLSPNSSGEKVSSHEICSRTDTQKYTTSSFSPPRSHLLLFARTVFATKGNKSEKCVKCLQVSLNL